MAMKFIKGGFKRPIPSFRRIKTNYHNRQWSIEEAGGEPSKQASARNDNTACETLRNRPLRSFRAGSMFSLPTTVLMVALGYETIFPRQAALFPSSVCQAMRNACGVT